MRTRLGGDKQTQRLRTRSQASSPRDPNRSPTECWHRLFILACVVGYLVLMLVVFSQVVSDALARQNVDASVVFGEGEASDAGLALAPLLGIPVTIFWTAINFIALSVVEWCFRTDFRSMFSRDAPSEHAVEIEPSEEIERNT